jgi:hypothetical protein
MLDYKLGYDNTDVCTFYVEGLEVLQTLLHCHVWNFSGISRWQQWGSQHHISVVANLYFFYL